MNIRPRIIPKFQNGGVPQWYLDRYGNRTSLIGWDLNKRYNYANQNLNTNDHRNAGNLDTVYSKNVAYTGTPGAISTDIQAFYDSDGKGLSAADFVKLYNENAAKIRSHWAQDQTYNARTAGDHNRLFKRMFQSRSNQDQSPGSGYNIGYQDNLENIEGSSTWLRRMDQYEKEFDINNPDSDRMHELTLSDGSKAIVYKKANGDIGLYEKSGGNPLGDKEIVVTPQKKVNEIPVGEYKQPESIWTKLGQGLNKVAPDLLDALRLAGNMYNNDRVYKESMKAIRPNLQQSYHTYRQVVGDEATKQGFYRRAAQGEQRAARPITSDLDKQIAYQNEAKRIGDELRAQGDLADNQRIRETSAESDAHTDANRERDTTVANSNLTELLKADAAKHQLTAQKYSADWTNLEQYLMGRQYKLEKDKAKDEELKRQLSLLDAQEKLIGDTKLRDLKTAADEAYDAYYKETDATKKAALKQKFEAANNAYQIYKIGITRENLKAQYAKEGVKITKKHKDTADKFLYKTSRDIVEHFRKMSKMTDDSRIKTLPKPIKLTSHPKKYQLGGVAPFTVYRPLGVGGENAVSTQTTSSTDSKSSKDTAAKDKLDMIKELFKAIQGQGLPIDVSTVYQEISGVLNKAKAFGEELSTDDIASMYLSSMQKINNLKYSKDVFDKAKAQATTNEALNEFAVTTGGKLVLQDREGKITTGTYADYVKSEGRLNPITNDQLLNLRAYSPDLALWKGDELMQIVNNGVGMNKIAAQIKSMAASIGSMENKIEGISQVESNKVKAGLQILAGVSGTPDGYYKVTTDSKDSQSKVSAALNYIMNMLPNNYKTVLEIHSGGRSKELIANFLTSQTNDYIKQDVTPLTGKAGDKNSNGSGEKGDSENSAGLAFVLGQGPRELISFNTGTSNEIEVLGIKGVLQTKSNENLGQGSTLQDATKSQQGGYLQWNKATFGGSKLNPSAYNHIILNDSTILGVDLPYTKDINGNEIPDFQMLRKMEQADDDIRQNNITDISQINQIYIKYGLDPKYTPDGKLNQLKYRRFAAIQATLDEQSLQNKDAILSDEVALAGEVERDLYKEIMKKSNKDYDLDDGFFGYFKDNLYKGTIFIPYSEDIAFAALSSGQPFNQDLPNNATTIQEKQYAPKISQYVSPQATLSQVKNN